MSKFQLHPLGYFLVLVVEQLKLGNLTIWEMPKQQQSGSEVDACSWWLSKWKPFSAAASCSNDLREEEGGMEWSDGGVWWTLPSTRKRRRIAGSSSGGGRASQRLKKKCMLRSYSVTESSAGEELSEGLMMMDRQQPSSSRYELASSRASSVTPRSSCCCCCCWCLDNNYDGGAAAECGGGYGSEAGYRGDGECGFDDVDDRDEEEKRAQGLHDQRMIELGNPKQPSRLRQRLHRRQKRWKLVEALSSRQLGVGLRRADVYCS